MRYIYICNREQKAQADPTYEIGNIDRRKPGMLWSPKESRMWEKLGIKYSVEEGTWECMECQRKVPTSAGRNMLIRASRKHGNGNKYWKKQKEEFKQMDT